MLAYKQSTYMIIAGSNVIFDYVLTPNNELLLKVQVKLIFKWNYLNEIYKHNI